ncbi:steroid transmembrane transporter SLC22A24-like isoform X1 [Perognathus longimembris pacificus]|uniref:steroid transmembrane transporter SLC22A24-like isoform X1 n=1 Tax=Perognathus longimembris pacificus TaxID=214514 RepID=UPI0020186348|nr:steroid transmembrane transporter SLC22A24-like isoform X1 [Perognathus longimembris pacificus]
MGETSCAVPMGFEALLDHVGARGRFQILQLVFFYIIIMISYPHVLLENFTAATPEHRCWVHVLDNHTVAHNHMATHSQQDLLRISIPLDSNLRPEKCRRFVQPQWQLLHLNKTLWNASEADTEPCVEGWVYDKSSFPSTIVTEWDLVCEHQSSKSIVQVVFMTGSLLGSLIFGCLSDRFGRKTILTWCLLQTAISDTCAAFAPTFFVYCSLRFLAGLSTMTVLSNPFNLITEWTRPQFQVLIALMTSYSTAQVLLGGLAYFFRSWVTLQLVLSIPMLVFCVFSRMAVESARWLIFSNQIEKGLEELRRVAHINGKKNAGETLTIEFVKSSLQEEFDEAQKKTSVFQLLHAPKLCMITCNLSFIRMTLAIAFYGLVLNLQHLGSNIFFFQILFGLVTFISRFVAYLALNYLGRRGSQILFMFLAGLSILVNTFLSLEMQQTLRLILATLGISAVTAGITAFSVHGTELTPTVMRSTIGGIGAIFSRSGAVMAPLFMTLAVYSPHLPWILYGAFPILSAIAVFYLPETSNQPLPNTIQDVENQTSSSRKVKKEDTSMKITQF